MGMYIPSRLSPGSDDIKEWQKQLRSSLHPALFAAVYFIVDKPMEYLGFFPQFRALILSVLPNAVQAIFAGLSDYYTWQLAEKIYGVGSNTAWVAVSNAGSNLKSTSNMIYSSS